MKNNRVEIGGKEKRTLSSEIMGGSCKFLTVVFVTFARVQTLRTGFLRRIIVFKNPVMLTCESKYAIVLVCDRNYECV